MQLFEGTKSCLSHVFTLLNENIVRPDAIIEILLQTDDKPMLATITQINNHNVSNCHPIHLRGIPIKTPLQESNPRPRA